MMREKGDYLVDPIEHIDVRGFDSRPIIDAMSRMSFQARNLASAAGILDRMLRDERCTVILSLAGSMVSAGLKRAFHTMVANDMVDVIVSTGANIVDMDFFEALGYRHYIGSVDADDGELQRLSIDRIYDTYIDEEELMACDATVRSIADGLEPRPYSSREFIAEMGRYLVENGSKAPESIVQAAFQKQVPIFVPAFTDCSAGFGLIDHQRGRPDEHLTIDSVADFRQLSDLCLSSESTGILVIGGGVPKNFVQDAVLGGPVDENGQLLEPARMHKYAVQVSVAFEYDGGLSGSTFREALSWGKVEGKREQMVFSEATIAIPLLVSYLYHSGAHSGRQPRMLGARF
jgi:deoxyhypusine synthase